MNKFFLPTSRNVPNKSKVGKIVPEVGNSRNGQFLPTSKNALPTFGTCEQQEAMVFAAMTNNINPHWRTILILFVILLLHTKKRIFRESSNFKALMHWDHSDSSNDDKNDLLSLFFNMSCRAAAGAQQASRVHFICWHTNHKQAEAMATGLFASSGLPTKTLSSTLLSGARWCSCPSCLCQ